MNHCSESRVSCRGTKSFLWFGDRLLRRCPAYCHQPNLLDVLVKTFGHPRLLPKTCWAFSAVLGFEETEETHCRLRQESEGEEESLTAILSSQTKAPGSDLFAFATFACSKATRAFPPWPWPFGWRGSCDRIVPRVVEQPFFAHPICHMYHRPGS